MNRVRPLFPCLLIFLASLLAACGNPLDYFTPVPGEVARINNRSITLSQLEAMQESANMYWGLDPHRSVEELRTAYGPALYELLAVELVKEQLEKKKLAVTVEELAAEEALIRADYEEGAFEDMLVTGAVNLDNWRFLLRNNLSVRKFQQEVLRPGVTISSAEIERYFAAHQQSFYLTAKEHFILIAGFEEEAVRRASAALMQSADEVTVQADNPDVLLHTVRMPSDRLAPSIREVLAQLMPGQMSPVIAVDGEFRSMLLLAVTPERFLSASEAYPLIEAILMEEKLNAAYNAWVREGFGKARIRISPHLVRDAE
jgi:hypothetical protein